MPETTMYKNDLISLLKHQIGTSGKFAIMQPVPVPQPMNQPANNVFWFGIPVPDQRHSEASLCLGQSVHCHSEEDSTALSRLLKSDYLGDRNKRAPLLYNLP